MVKKIAILGSTGSIGKNLINIIKKDKKKFKIILLSANKNYRLLLKQVKTIKVENVIISDKKSFQNFIKKNKNKKLKVYNCFNDFNKIFKTKVDYTMGAISGLQGLIPTFSIIKYTKKLALANKESIICGWNLIRKELKKNNTEFVPVDSEHFSIWYALKKNKEIVENIVLTASGGPLNTVPLNKIKNVKISQALNHPNWSMGKKISIDSATMMNKVFEIIEAKNIFNISYKKLKILIHPSSYVHTIIKFKNGIIKIVAHDTDMKIPIFNTLDINFKKNIKTSKIDISKLNNLSLNKVDIRKFPLTKIISILPEKSTLFETVIVSANDELVNLFLKNKIKFTDISKKLLMILKNKEFNKYKRFVPKNISQIIKLNNYVRLKINPKSI